MDSTNLRSCTMFESTLAESAGGESMSAEGRLKRPESFVSMADPRDGLLRTCTRQSVVLFHTRQNQKKSLAVYMLHKC